MMVLMVAMLTANTTMAMSQDVTMQVGETKTLNLPSSFTNMYPYCKSTTWMSYGNEYVSVTSSTLFSVTVKAIKALSTPVIVRCNYYYYLLQGGKYVYGGTTFYDFVVTVEGSQPTAISLSPSEATLDRGKSVNLKPVLTPSNASTKYTWTTSNEGVASVDQTGHVIGQNYGEATITCKTANGLAANCYVTVSRPAPTSVSIDDLMELAVGQSSTLTPTLTPSNASTSYTWKSDNNKAATVDGSGKVTGIKKGSARITVTTANGLSDYCYVTVYAPSPSSVSIKSSITLEVGETETLIPTLTPSYAETSYSWNSSNPNVATVSTDGTVIAISPGTCTITVVTANNKCASCQATVKEQTIQPTSVSMRNTLEMTVGDEYTLSPTLSPSNATTTFSWNSSNSDVATVSPNGTVKAVSRGTATINVKTDNGKTASCQVTVSEQVVQPTNICMKDCLNLTVGDEYLLTPTVTPSNSTTTISWSSSDENVATVIGGLVKAEGIGVCEILATTSNNLTAKCCLVVTQSAPDDTNSDIMAEWEGTYHFIADVTRFMASEMSFDETFDMTITNKDGTYYITSMMECNTVFIIYEGLQLRIIDSGHAEIVLRYNNCLGNPINGGYYSNLHELNPDDQYVYIHDQVIPITRKADRTMEMGDFNIYAFGSDTEYEFLKEAKYSMVRGFKLNEDGIMPAVAETDGIEIYDLNGIRLFEGTKEYMPALPKGIYVLRNGKNTWKMLVK